MITHGGPRHRPALFSVTPNPAKAQSSLALSQARSAIPHKPPVDWSTNRTGDRARSSSDGRQSPWKLRVRILANRRHVAFKVWLFRTREPSDAASSGRSSRLLAWCGCVLARTCSAVWAMIHVLLTPYSLSRPCPVSGVNGRCSDEYLVGCARRGGANLSGGRACVVTT